MSKAIELSYRGLTIGIPDTLSSLAIVGGILAAYIAWRFLYALFLSPLRQIPGPLVAKVTGNWLLLIELSGNRAKRVHKLHQKYGPAVQISPNEVSFITADAVDTIYGPQSNFPKALWYKNMTRGGVFNTLDPAQHRERRRLLTHAFSPASIADMEPIIREQQQKLLRIIETHCRNGPINIRHWVRMVSFDISGAVFLGKAFGGLDSEKTPGYIEDLDIAFIVWDLQGRFPLLSRFARLLPVKALQHFFTADDRIYQYGEDAFQDYLDRYGRTAQRKDLLMKLIRKPTGETEGPTDAQISSEISNLTFAATDTSALTLTYLLWELAQHPDLQALLREELKDVPTEAGAGVPEHRDVVNLPILNATIQEAMRKHPPVPMGLLRETPRGGKIIGGYHIPEKTVVSVPSWTTHRNPRYFPDPEAFKPQRWLGVDSDVEEMKRLYLPFSKGARGCIGQAMALLELRLTTASLIKRYVVTVNKDMKMEDMDFIDHFAMIPKGNACLLDFAPVADI